MSQRGSRWNNRKILLSWVKRLRGYLVRGKISTLARAFDLAIEQLEKLTQK